MTAGVRACPDRRATAAHHVAAGHSPAARNSPARPARAGGSGRGFWLRLDPLATVVLGTISVLFVIAAFYAPGYLALRRDRDNRVFCSGLLIFLAMTSLLALAQHLGLMWVAMEATTLATAPLLYFNRTARSLEATWKYLMIGSVGIAIALLGSLFLA